MKSEKFIVLICTLYSVLCTPLSAQTSMLSIGVRGGGQTFLPTAAVGATGEVKPGIGGTGALDVRYTYYGSVASQVQLGVAVGAGFGYGTTGIKGTNMDSYTNIDYLGNKMDYSIDATYSLKDQFAKVDVSLLLAMRFGGVTLNVGPRFMLPFATTGTVTISEASIDAYYPLYNVHVTDQLITGKLETPYTEKHPSNISKYNLLIAAEIGYEWRLNQHALGVQLFAEAAVWSKQSPITNYQSPMISVAPISNANAPVPSVTVGSAESFVSGRRYIGVGVRAYYAFHIEHIRIRQFKPRGDSRDHRNRYLWW